MERIERWLEETRDPRFELVRHFFVRSFDSELVSTPGQLQSLYIGILAAFCAFSLLLPLRLFRKYVDLCGLDTPDLYIRAALADKLFFLLLAMTVVGFLAALQWHALFPSTRDYLVLCPLPVKLSEIFAAKFIALFLFVSLFVAVLNLFSSIALPAVLAVPAGVGQRWGVRPVGFRGVLAHGAAAWSAAYFVFFALVGVQGMLMNLLPPRLFSRSSVYLQAGALLLLLCLLPLLFSVPNLYGHMHLRPAWAVYVPPLWFLGLYETLAGNPEPYFHHLAREAVLGFAIVIIGTLALYFISYRRHASRLLEMPSSPTDRRSRAGQIVSTLGHWAMPRSREQAAFAFLWKTMTRSRQHKVFLAAYIGTGVAMVVDGILTLAFDRGWSALQTSNRHLLQTVLTIPLVLSFFVLTGMRYVFSLPTELRANWIFRVTEGEDRATLLAANEKALLWLGVAPVLLATLPVELTVLGWQRGLWHLAFTVLMTLILVEAMVFRFERIPFTCSYLPGKRNVTQVLLLYWMAFSAYAYTLTFMEAWALQRPGRILVLLAVLGAAYGFTRKARLESWGQAPLLFDDLPEPEIRTLGLQRE